MPNRLIKESIRTSEKISGLSDFQFRLWVSLITYVDDYGRGDARAAIIKGACFPLRERVTVKDIDSALSALAGAGCVGLYDVDGKPYLYFPKWEQHQRIQTKKSRYPAPPEISPWVTVSHGDPPPESESESESESNPNPNDCAEQQAASAPVAALLLNDGSFFEATEAYVQRLVPLYPAVDVAQELRNMAGWCLSNAKKRKTRSGIERFITSWLAREQNSGGSRRGKTQKPGGDTPKDVDLDAMKNLIDSL